MKFTKGMTDRMADKVSIKNKGSHFGISLFSIILNSNTKNPNIKGKLTHQ